MNIQIIKANLSNPIHAEALVFLLDAYARDPMGGGQGLSPFTKTHLATELNKRENIIVLLAFDHDKPVGLLNAIEGFSTFSCKPLMNIHDVTVLPEFRGQGISKILFQEVEKHALSKGCCKMTLEVLKDNSLAQTAYTQFGYTKPSSSLTPSLGTTFFWTKDL